MSLQIYKRPNPDDLKRELCADRYHDLFRSIETCLNDKKLEKRADQAAKKMGGKYKALAKKFAKVIKNAHSKRAAELKAKKNAEVT